MATKEGMIRECAEEACRQLEKAYPQHIESLYKGSEEGHSMWLAKQMIQTIIDIMDDMDADEWLTEVGDKAKKYYGEEE